MEIYDLTMPMTPEMPVYKNREANRPSITRDRCHETDAIQESRFNINVHTGTHLDAPLHILPGGAAIEAYPLERLQVACQVVDLSEAGRAIDAPAFVGLAFYRDTAVLLKTVNSHVDRFEQGLLLSDRRGRGISGRKASVSRRHRRLGHRARPTRASNP